MQHIPAPCFSPAAYLRMLLYTLAALLMRVVALAPLAFLASQWWYLALLCPLLMVFFVLPLRFSFAEAVFSKRFSVKEALNLSRYGEKLTEGLLHALSVSKWGLLLAAMLACAAYWYQGVDFPTVFATLTAMGKGATDVLNAVISVPDGGMMTGVCVALGALGLAALLWLYGAVRNSATRYLWALATLNDRDMRKERRRALMCRRLRQLGAGLVNLLLCVPFWAAVILCLKDVLVNLADILLTAYMTQTLPALDLSQAVLPLILSFALLYLPLVPVRRVLTAQFAARGAARRRGVAS